MPAGAFVKEEVVVPPMPPDAIMKREHTVVVKERRSARMAEQSGVGASDGGVCRLHIIRHMRSRQTKP